MSIVNQFLALGLQTKLLIAGAGLFIIGSILQAIGDATSGGGDGGGGGKRGKACAWCGQEIQGKEQKCSLCRDKFCSQKCVLEHKQAMHAPKV